MHLLSKGRDAIFLRKQASFIVPFTIISLSVTVIRLSGAGLTTGISCKINRAAFVFRYNMALSKAFTPFQNSMVDYASSKPNYLFGKYLSLKKNSAQRLRSGEVDQDQYSHVQSLG